MPRAIRKGLDLSLGHVGNGTISLPLGTENVFVGGFPAIKQGDVYQPHEICPTPGVPRPAILGSFSVFVNGFQMIREGDLISCGDTANSNMGDDAKVFVDEPSIPSSGGSGGNGYVVNASIRTFPVVKFKPKGFYTYQVSRDVSRRFLNGCPVEIPIETAYTEIQTEGFGILRNYPGPPMTVQSGVENPPPNFAEVLTRPIKIDIIFLNLPEGWYFEENKIKGTSFATARVYISYKAGIRLPNGEAYFNPANSIIRVDFRPSQSNCP